MKKTQRDWLAVGVGALVGASLIGTAVACYDGYQKYQLQLRPRVERVARDFLTPGTQMEIVVLTPNRHPVKFGTRVISGNRVFLLKSLDQMQGLVSIETASQALHFVRLRTTLCNQSQQEQADEIASLTDFNKPGTVDLEHQVLADPFQSGMYGILSDAAYRRGKFTPTSAAARPGDFTIIRWVWIHGLGPKDHLEQWRETVTPNGAYAQTTLKAEPMPNLPNTQFGEYAQL